MVDRFVIGAVTKRKICRDLAELVHIKSKALSDMHRGVLITAVAVEVNADSSLDDSILDAWMWTVQPSRGMGTTPVL